jgi:hypothetical protein
LTQRLSETYAAPFDLPEHGITARFGGCDHTVDAVDVINSKGIEMASACGPKLLRQIPFVPGLYGRLEDMTRFKWWTWLFVIFNNLMFFICFFTMLANQCSSKSCFLHSWEIKMETATTDLVPLQGSAKRKRASPSKRGLSGRVARHQFGARAVERLLEEEVEAITSAVIDKALMGDMNAARLCLERIVASYQVRGASTHPVT